MTTITTRDLVNQEWLTVAQTAELLGVSNASVQRWIRNGDLAALALGSRKEGYRISQRDLDIFIASRYHPARHTENEHQEHQDMALT